MMMRLLGFVTGAAGVIGAMVILLGAPAVQEAAVPANPGPVADGAAPIETLAGDHELPLQVAEPVPMPAAEPVAGPQSETPTGSAPASVGEQAPEPRSPARTAPANGPRTETLAYSPEQTSDAKTVALAATSELANDAMNEAIANTPATDALWHPFWQPFRSQIAANGFASRLTAITDIDYRVLRLKPDAYQVAFAYADEPERNAKLAQIERATGLRVAEVSQ